MERNQMTFYRSYFESGMCIQSPKERLAFFEAIIELGINGREIDLKGTAKAIFTGIKPNILRNNKRAEIRLAREENDTTGMTNGCNKNEFVDPTAVDMPYIGERERERERDIGIGIERVRAVDRDGYGFGNGAGAGEGGNCAAGAGQTHTHEKPGSFAPPSVDEVRQYCSERGNNVDPERFVDYYSACGWLIGKHPMKDWKAAVRSWEKNGFQSGSAEEKPSDSSFDRDAFFEAAVRHSMERRRKRELVSEKKI